jgi:Domain of unknown function (DUF4411)
MKQYCLDTSGLSSPLEFMPEDIHPTIWGKITDLISQSKFAVTAEIYDELKRLPGSIGECINAHKMALQLEVEDDDWDWQTYLGHYEEMKVKYESVISEYNGNRKNTVGLNDITIIALAKTLDLPVISSEKKTSIDQDSVKR